MDGVNIHLPGRHDNAHPAKRRVTSTSSQHKPRHRFLKLPYLSTSAMMADEFTADDTVTHPVNTTRRSKSAIAALLGLLLLVNLAASLYQLPLNVVVERRLCLDYYRRHDPSQIPSDRSSIDESLCKIDSVQQGLGWVQGTMDTIWVMGGQ